MTIGLRTLGTTANNSLVALQYTHVSDGLTAQPANTNVITPAALASINSQCKFDNQGALSNQEFDTNAASPTFQVVGHGGVLNVPGRGQLKIRQGDIVAIDTQTGWPILLSGAAAASNPAWVLSAVTS